MGKSNRKESTRKKLKSMVLAQVVYFLICLLFGLCFGFSLGFARSAVTGWIILLGILANSWPKYDRLARNILICEAVLASIIYVFSNLNLQPKNPLESVKERADSFYYAGTPAQTFPPDALFVHTPINGVAVQGSTPQPFNEGVSRPNIDHPGNLRPENSKDKTSGLKPQNGSSMSYTLPPLPGLRLTSIENGLVEETVNVTVTREITVEVMARGDYKPSDSVLVELSWDKEVLQNTVTLPAQISIKIPLEPSNLKCSINGDGFEKFDRTKTFFANTNSVWKIQLIPKGNPG